MWEGQVYDDQGNVEALDCEEYLFPPSIQLVRSLCHINFILKVEKHVKSLKCYISQGAGGVVKCCYLFIKGTTVDSNNSPTANQGVGVGKDALPGSVNGASVFARDLFFLS